LKHPFSLLDLLSTVYRLSAEFVVEPVVFTRHHTALFVTVIDCIRLYFVIHVLPPTVIIAKFAILWDRDTFPLHCWKVNWDGQNSQYSCFFLLFNMLFNPLGHFNFWLSLSL